MTDQPYDRPSLVLNGKRLEYFTLGYNLSAILLGGLVLNAVAGWWWADPIAALVMVPIIAREGIEALREKQCHCH